MLTRVSLADVARKTGFTPSTVSKALRGIGTMPASTREKIRKSADSLGYRPNPLLASLARRHFGAKHTAETPLASFHLPEANPDDQVLVQKILQIQQEHARKLGYRLEAFKVSDFKDGAHATKVLFSRGFLGIVLPTHFRLDLLPGMDWDRFSVVGWGESVVDASDSTLPLLYRATVDHFRVVLQAWEEVWKRGYRRIGFALFQAEQPLMDEQLRWGAVRNCLQGIPARLRIPPFAFRIPFQGPFNFSALGKWTRRNRPEAVIGFNGFIRWALEHEGFRIPEDFGFAVLHRDVDSELILERGNCDSGMKEMRLQSMLTAVELLDQQIRHHQYGMPPEPRTILINSEWVEGETLPQKN
jgi:DNA-binding LacI/PurR family transcriptional regulator